MPALARACLQLAAFALLPLALYFALFHPATLDPGNVAWLIYGTDNGQNALGFHAWLAEPHKGWWPATTLLNAPDGVSMLFTDANPLLALIVAPLAPWLPHDFQLVGPWILACLMLHSLFAWALLRDHAPSPIALWLGVAMFLLLPTLANRFVHANLTAHWLILWGLWLFLDARRAGDLRWWAALMFVAAMVHNYLLLMVAAIWASAMLERFAASDGRARTRLAAGSLAILGAVTAIALLHGAGERFEITRSYGAFAMSLDALWNPANPDYSAFLPATPQRQGRGMEGFQYLGAGLMPLLAAAAAIRFARRDPSSDLVRLAWLAPALAVLTALALTPSLDFAGQPVARLGYPEWAARALDTVRASGRLFWPVAYVLVLLAVRMAYRLSAERAALLLGACAAIQIADLSGMFAAIRRESIGAADGRTYRRTPSSDWQAAIARARYVTFVPADANRDLPLFQEIAWRATGAGVPVRLTYAARTGTATAQRLAREDTDFAAGRLEPDRLYILLPGTQVPAAARARLTQIDGVRVLLPLR
ncbi:DUF6311 domain-containing protein [Sphingomonas baiyangensis]|uniref:Uncharacterized protein n=1 Tax=Sphingomonas baiyangensis TaxID=2572576 RepID=A0A4U1L1Y6_9SPHN|nr:DUF6311 domain-containing protein [Sphingomonas baiyangensis]TKD50871.1 hypothetical protein FBR43_08890 [Sphingomonas baiyangensis]